MEFASADWFCRETNAMRTKAKPELATDIGEHLAEETGCGPGYLFEVEVDRAGRELRP
jgi:hypothetical protein